MDETAFDRMIEEQSIELMIDDFRKKERAFSILRSMSVFLSGMCSAWLIFSILSLKGGLAIIGWPIAALILSAWMTVFSQEGKKDYGQMCRNEVKRKDALQKDALQRYGRQAREINFGNLGKIDDSLDANTFKLRPPSARNKKNRENKKGGENHV